LRDNQLAEIKGLNQGLNRINNLEQLNMQGNPVVEEKGEAFKTEILILTNQTFKLKKLNKEEVTEEDQTNANNEREERRKAEEEARLEKERRAAEGGDQEQPAEDE
jgi:hypothetical protein